VSTVPESIGRFRISRLLGEGGMGTLYLAQDPVLDRPVAIKVMKQDNDEYRERFAREARTVAGLRHVNIVQIFDSGTFEGRQFIAMEFIPGESLAEMIHRRGPLGLRRKLQLIDEICTGLGYAHQRGIVHRDVKPANIMVDVEGTLKILDFGIAQFGPSSITHPGTLVGTVNYMSPEAVSGALLDQRSDIFAVGAVFYELLTYRKAFDGAIVQALMNVAHHEPERLDSVLPGIDGHVQRVVQRALEKNPAKRYQDLTEMRHDLALARAGIDTGEPESPSVVISHDAATVTILGPRALPKEVQIEALLAHAGAAMDAGDLAAARVTYDKASELGAATPAPQSAPTPVIEPVPHAEEVEPKRAPDAGAGRQWSSTRQRFTAWATVAAAILIAVLGYRMSSSGVRSPAAPGPAGPSAAPPPARESPRPGGVQEGPAASPPAAASPVLVVIDAAPWAQITITPTTPGLSVDVGEQITPCIVRLPPGDYSVRLVNDRAGPPSTQPLHVSTEPRQQVTFRLPAYDPDAVVRTILGAR
jgi:predicted Ser/Thr protein kinase